MSDQGICIAEVGPEICYEQTNCRASGWFGVECDTFVHCIRKNIYGYWQERSWVKGAVSV